MIARTDRVLRFRGQYYRLVRGRPVGDIPEELRKNLLLAGLIRAESTKVEKPVAKKSTTKKRGSKKQERLEDVIERRTDVDAEDSGEERVFAWSEGGADNSAE